MCCKHRFWVLWLSCRASCFVILFICGQLPCVMFLGPQSRSTKTYFILLRMHCIVDRGWQVFFVCVAVLRVLAQVIQISETRQDIEPGRLTRQSSRILMHMRFVLVFIFNFQAKLFVFWRRSFWFLSSLSQLIRDWDWEASCQQFLGFDTRLIRFI